MGKYPVYAIVALVFVGIIKLLQVTTFDSEQYEKNKKSSFTKPFAETETPYNKESSEDTTEVVDDSSMDEQLALDTTQIESSEETTTDEVDNAGEAFESPEPVVESTRSYSGLDDLKNNYLAPIIAALPSGQLREDVVVRYYRHEQDGDGVYSLRKLGYYIHEKEATETAGLGSNVLYYGDDVSVEDIQIIAYTLLDEGLPLKSITPTQFSWKSNSLEIGTDTLLIDRVTITSDYIKNFSK